MLVPLESFDEIRVYEGVAERTGVHFERSAVRRSEGCCGTVTALVRKARASGDGTYYLPLYAWPADTERLQLRKPWVVMGSRPRPLLPD
jgi:hypothetical protein